MNEFLAAHPSIDKKFVKYEKAKFLYSWAEGLLVYPQIHRRVTHKNSFRPSENYYDFLSLMDVNDSDLLEVDEFRSFLSTYLDQKKDELKQNEPEIFLLDNQNTYLQYRVVLETFSNPTLKNLYLFEAMKNQIENYGILGIEDLMEDFEENCTEEKYLEEIGLLYDNDVSLRQDAETIIYKTVGNIPLEMHLFFPEDTLPRVRRPAIVFFHGGGWSAGGHIAACAGIIKGFDETEEDQDISSVPDAMVFWFPAVYLTDDNWFRQVLRGKVDVDDVDPTRHIRSGLSPAIIFQGTADTTVPFYGVKIFSDKMKEVGNRCNLHVYEGREHLFHSNPDDYIDTMIKVDQFLSSLGFLEEEPDIDWFNK